MRGRRLGLLIAVASLVVLCDQATKYHAVAGLTDALDGAATLGERLARYARLRNLDNEPPAAGGVDHRKAPAVVVERYWQHRYVENPGAAWGLLSRVDDSWRRPFFHAVSLLALVAIVGFYRRLEAGQRLLAAALPLILGGALGNWLDRLIHGYVIDFVDWHWRNQPGLHWPTFNLADSAIVAGVLLMLAETFTAGRGAAERAPSEPGGLAALQPPSSPTALPAPAPGEGP